MADSGSECSGRYSARISPELIRRRTEVQASGIWSPPSGTLGRIVAEAAIRVTELRPLRSSIEKAAADAPRPSTTLRAALNRDHVAVIAEVKRKSPSKGWIKAGISSA